MSEILTVCTGNICRSPLAAHLLRVRLAPLVVTVTSAGTRGIPDVPMTEEALRLASALGVSAEEAAGHRSRFLLETHLSSPDLILTMTREHRRCVAELAPTRLRSTFTVREFARLWAAVPRERLLRAADEGAQDASARVRAMAAEVASHRGVVPPPSDPLDDDVIDPFGRTWETYQKSAAQLVPAVDAVVAAVRLAMQGT